ncbi:hypothetical protein [Paenibacillus ihuae]|uniref:hypothetical protein n=1 Tax=Paenibacillus ihuae TaxID=1232431 RepID=UPI0006D5904C|nr:hypothetical protein [Paenibacillus ihuae]
MSRAKWFTVSAAVVFAASIALNVYSAYRIHESSDNEGPGNDYAAAAAELIQSVDRLEVEVNSANGNMNADGIYELRETLLKLPDVTKKLAFVQDFSQEDGILSLDLDVVEWFSGEEAEAAAKEDGNPEASSLANGFYIRNTSDELETIKLEPDVQIDVLEEARLQAVQYQDFYSTELKDRLFYYTAVGGKVVLLQEMYRP